MKKIRLISAISLLGMLCLFLLLAKKGSSNQFVHRMVVLPNLVEEEISARIRTTHFMTEYLFLKKIFMRRIRKESTVRKVIYLKM